MDINQDLQDLVSHKRGVLEIINDLDEQEKQIKKRKHLIKIVDAAEGLHKLSEEKQFEDHQIKSMVISYRLDHDYDDQNNGYVVTYKLINKNDKEISRNHGNKYFLDALDDYFDYLANFNPDNINPLFNEKEEIIITADKNLAGKFLDLMLSPELKLIVQYNDLQNSLSIKSHKKESKAKL